MLCAVVCSMHELQDRAGGILVLSNTVSELGTLEARHGNGTRTVDVHWEDFQFSTYIIKFLESKVSFG